MKQTIVPFDLPAWRQRMAYTQATAAGALGLSLSGYTRAEYRCQDAPGFPVNATVAKLAQLLEMREQEQYNRTTDDVLRGSVTVDENECTCGPDEEPHSCPFQYEINENDDDSYCRCCSLCTHQCLMDI